MVVEAHGRIIETDPEGFLVDLDEWDEQVAHAMAAADLSLLTVQGAARH